MARDGNNQLPSDVNVMQELLDILKELNKILAVIRPVSSLKREETIALLNIAQQQRQHWSTLITSIMGFTVAFVSAIWAFSLPEYIKDIHNNFYSPLWLVVGASITSVIVVLWRFYTRYIDNKLAHNFPEIIYYEALLEVPIHTGLTAYLINMDQTRAKVIAKSNKTVADLFSSSTGLTPLQKFKAVEWLVDARKIGDRGHRSLDIGALLYVLLMVLGSIIVWCITCSSNPSNCPTTSGCLFIFLYSTLYLFIFICLIFMSIILCLNHSNPKSEHINKAINHAKYHTCNQ
jgi:hypothetical protein